MLLSLLASVPASVDFARIYSRFGATPAYGTVLSVAEVAPGLRGLRTEEDVEPGGLLLRVRSDGCLLCRRGPEDDVQLSRLLLDAIADDEGYGPVWDEYRAAMVADRRVLLTLPLEHVYGWTGPG